MNKDVTPTDLVEQDTLSSVVEKAGIVPGERSNAPEEQPKDSMLDTGYAPV